MAASKQCIVVLYHGKYLYNNQIVNFAHFVYMLTKKKKKTWWCFYCAASATKAKKAQKRKNSIAKQEFSDHPSVNSDEEDELDKGPPQKRAKTKVSCLPPLLDPDLQFVFNLSS
jgi:hypothetical protein